MKSIILKVTTVSILASSILVASGWRIPEQSSRSTALSGAYVSNANGADSSYYNPANMSFNENRLLFEGDFTYINLPKLDYTGTVAGIPANGSSQTEQFFVPTIFLSSKDYSGFRYGFSITAPGGLSKKWETPFQKAYAQEFTLEILEFNPVVSYALSPKFSIGGGLRAIYSHGIVKSDASLIGTNAQRDLEGDTIEFGYNLALSYRPTKELKFALTYRSNIDMKEEGNSKLYLNGTKVYDGGASVSIPLPAVLAFAASYTFNGKTTVEFEFDRTYWSEYKDLDFNYKSPIPAILVPSFDDPIAKNWKDSNAYRIGITHQYNDKLKLLAGFAIDKTPIPSTSLGFELPSADAKLYSVGFEYKYNDKMTFGMGYLYDSKDDRTISAADANVQHMVGKFTNISAHLLTLSLKYRF